MLHFFRIFCHVLFITSHSKTQFMSCVRQLSDCRVWQQLKKVSAEKMEKRLAFMTCDLIRFTIFLPHSGSRTAFVASSELQNSIGHNRLHLFHQTVVTAQRSHWLTHPARWRKKCSNAHHPAPALSHQMTCLRCSARVRH